MRQARFTIRAEADLDEIAAYTYRRWGKPQAAQYIKALRGYCGMLAKNPRLGRPCPQILPGLRRSETGSHVILFRETESGIMVARILHERMLPERHMLDEGRSSNLVGRHFVSPSPNLPAITSFATI